MTACTACVLLLLCAAMLTSTAAQDPLPLPPTPDGNVVESPPPLSPPLSPQLLTLPPPSDVAPIPPPGPMPPPASPSTLQPAADYTLVQPPLNYGSLSVGPGRINLGVDIVSMYSTDYHLAVAVELHSGDSLTMQGYLAPVTPEVSVNDTGAPRVFRTGVGPSHNNSIVLLSRADLGYSQLRWLVLQFSNDGNLPANFTVSAVTSSCPVDIDLSAATLTAVTCNSPTGAATRKANATCLFGVCQCLAPYASPVAALYPGLGFQDCSSTFDSTGFASSSVAAPSITVTGSVAAGYWSFYQFPLDATAGQAFVTVTALNDTNCQLHTYLKAGQPPASVVGQYDARSEDSAWASTRTATASIDTSSPMFHRGTWYIGVYGTGSGAASFEVLLVQNQCLNACYGQGTCNPTAHACTCSDPSTYSGADCGVTRRTVPNQLTATPSVYPYVTRTPSETLILSNLSAYLTSQVTAIQLNVTFTTDPPLSALITARPTLLLSTMDGAAESDVRLRLPLLQPAVPAMMQVSRSNVGVNDTLYMTLLNPLAGFKVAYTLAMSLVGQCIEQCSGHGVCQPTGVCKCNVNFDGADCSVDLVKLSVSQSCLEGSLALSRKVQGGTAYTLCTCGGPGDCSYTYMPQSPDVSNSSSSALLCGQGYKLQGAKSLALSNGAVSIGGQCVISNEMKPNASRSPGMIFFWCLLAIALAFALFFGSRRCLAGGSIRSRNLNAYTNDWDTFTNAKMVSLSEKW